MGHGPAHVLRLQRAGDKFLRRLGYSLEDEDVARPAVVIREIDIDAHPDELPALSGEAPKMVVKQPRVEPGIHPGEIPDIDGMFDRSHRSVALRRSYSRSAAEVPGPGSTCSGLAAAFRGKPTSIRRVRWLLLAWFVKRAWSRWQRKHMTARY